MFRKQIWFIYFSGNINFLRKFKVPIGGDQLTRVRLQEAKNLRTLSVTPEKKLEDLYPIVCELWHSKQDFLEKCFKKFYKAEISPGTLYYFKTLLHRNNVNGKVKGRFQPHFDLLMAVGEGLITEQLLEFFQMDHKHSTPKHPLLTDLKEKQKNEQKDVIMQVMQEFVKKYGYGMIDRPDQICKEKKKPVNIVKRYRAVITNTKQILLQPYFESDEVIQADDELYNYSVQLCHWYLHLCELHDTAKEGDLNRAIINCKYAVPFFYSHSKLSKYMVENIDYVLKTDCMLSPLQRTRVLEGSFVNIRGGKGRNVESDLVQEHSVCNQKCLIKTLGANKTDKSISRVTSSADTIAEICSQFDNSIQLNPKSSIHSKAISSIDQDTIYKQLRKIRPFQLTPGRKCKGFSNIKPVPVSEKDIPAMIERINNVILRLTRGPCGQCRRRKYRFEQ